ncbi:MAG: SDR family oxidoreductase [Eubacteriales bacterium]|nr:SDR family oxidoreductase [Eubacteriales bacterium]
MKALLIGGTGNISLSVSRLLIKEGWELTLLNRGNQNDLVPEARPLIADINDAEAARAALKGRQFDAVVQFIAYHREEVFRDINLFTGITGQYIFISTASAYQKPPRNYPIDESIPLHNPYWQYSREKALCEKLLMEAYDMDFFPVTIVRPSHTYGESKLPLAIHGHKGAWQVLSRMLEKKPVLIPGDGTSLWTVTTSDDFARGLVGLMGNQRAIGQAVHITSDEALSWNQIHRIVADAAGVPFIPCHVPSAMLAMAERYDFSGSLLGDKANCAVFDNSKLKALVPGFTAPTRFDQGARRVVENFMSTPALQVPDPDFDAFSDKVVDIVRLAETEIARL